VKIIKKLFHWWSEVRAWWKAVMQNDCIVWLHSDWQPLVQIGRMSLLLELRGDHAPQLSKEVNSRFNIIIIVQKVHYKRTKNTLRRQIVQCVKKLYRLQSNCAKCCNYFTLIFNVPPDA